MSIRKINKYKVSTRFSLASRMFDEKDVVYIQEIDLETEATQIVFDKDKNYVFDIDQDTYLNLKNGFIFPDLSSNVD